MTVGDQIGRIIGAPPGSTVMHQNVAIAEAIVVSCFRPVDPHRNRVVYEEGNFPSVRYLYQAQPELDVVVVEDDQAIVEAIDERTLLVPITHVLFKTGEIQDVAGCSPCARGRRAHRPRRLPVRRDHSADVTAERRLRRGRQAKWLCGRARVRWLRPSGSCKSRADPSWAGRPTHPRPSPSSTMHRCGVLSPARQRPALMPTAATT